MVAGRLRRLAGSGYDYGTLKMNGQNESDDDETTPMQRQVEGPGERLRRTVEMAIKAKRRSKLKDRLREGATDVYAFDGYRKSDEELKAMDKKVRAFYEEQNKRLDDWIEVNAIVRRVHSRVDTPVNC